MCKPLDPILQMIAGEAGVRPPHVYHTYMAMKSERTRFNPASFAHFCQLEEKHILAIMAALERHNVLSGAVPKVPSEKGVRLPADFVMPSDWLLFAQVERGWTLDVAKTEAASFIDFWHSAPGQRGVKLNWQATWRNWVRNSRKANGEWRQHTGPQIDKEEAQRKTIALYRRMGRDYEADELERGFGR
jgi:hypothetical protein